MKIIEGKVVVLGSQGVGKTCMVVRYQRNKFLQHVTPTLGASFFSCKIILDDVKVKLNVWDTAGQERFRSLASMYYRGANAALLVFDITRYHTFTSVKYWAKELTDHVEEPAVLCLVGNKLDLAHEREVSREEALQYAESIGGFYHESSALQDHGIQDIFNNIAKELKKHSNDTNSTLKVYEATEYMTNAMLEKDDNPESVSIAQVQNEPTGDPYKTACCS